MVWSNEDGGTGARRPLMAQWGRTTDIEWIYRVEVDAKGRRVAGSGVFQSPNHGTTVFRGRYDGTHPLLQTCTSNNNVCDARALERQRQTADPMRFALSTRAVLGAAQPREHEMDINPWTYQVMGREMVREDKVDRPAPDPSTAALADQRTYLYLALNHDALRRRVGPRRGRRPEERPDDDVLVGPPGSARSSPFTAAARPRPRSSCRQERPPPTSSPSRSAASRRCCPVVPTAEQA